MPLLVDTCVLYALADRKDAWHTRVVRHLEANAGPLLAPATIVAEVAYLMRARLGAKAEQAFAESLAVGEIAVEPFTLKDWKRTAQLMATYDVLGFVDASVVAIAERLRLDTIATTDRRDFSLVRPAHVERFTLVP